MICPNCKQKASIVDRAYNSADNEMYKKNKCQHCGYSFFSVEYEVEQNKGFEDAWMKAKYLDKPEKEKVKKPRANSKLSLLGFNSNGEITINI